MKTVGSTVDGNYLVEMTPSEHWIMKRLEMSLIGAYTFGSPNPNINSADLSPVFKALDDLANAKVSIYKVQEYINSLALIFGGYVRKDSEDA